MSGLARGTIGHEGNVYLDDHRTWLVLYVCVTGCISYPDAVRQRFANQYGCEQVAVQPLGANSYRATGCGLQALFTCNVDPSQVGGAAVCVEESSTARSQPVPAPTQASAYPLPPADGRSYEHFDEFERQTVVQAEMVVGNRVLRVFGAPRRNTERVFTDFVVPGGPPPGPDCTELLVLVGEDVSRLPVSAALVEAGGTPFVRFEVPLELLARGVAAGSFKCRFCGVDWQFTAGQILNLRAFLARFRDVSLLEPPAPASPP